MSTNEFAEFLKKCLDELNLSPDRTDFVEGQIYAYVECLETILSDTANKEELMNLERKYGIRHD